MSIDPNELHVIPQNLNGILKDFNENLEVFELKWGH